MAVAGIVLVADVEACDGTGQQQCGGDQLALALLFRNLYICGVELEVSVGIQSAEKVEDDLFLPINQLKRLFCSACFRVRERLDECHHLVRCSLIVMRSRRSKPGRFIAFKVAHRKNYHFHSRVRIGSLNFTEIRTGKCENNHDSTGGFP